MKILVLGCKGQLGRCLNDQLKNTDHEVIYTSREQIDIADFQVTKNKILKISPEVIINATAYTAVDNAEEDHETADLINHLAVKNIADICNQLECWLIHVSTDYVFDGKSKVPYKEDDQTNPQGAYGETKLKGELAIQASGCKHIIIRTAWVFSEYGNNFLKTMLRLGAECNELSIVGDQIGCPTYAQDIARSIVEIIPQLNARKDNGIYHYCGDQPCSWYDFANAIFDQAMANNLKIPSIVNSIETSAYPTPAKRPAFSVLNCSKIENDFCIQPSDWARGISKVIDKLSSDAYEDKND
jgi:dTDP-4-dehydrorhamnose reductase